MEASRRAQRRRLEKIGEIGHAGSTTGSAEGQTQQNCTRQATGEQDVLLQVQSPTHLDVPSNFKSMDAGWVFQAAARCPWPFILVVGALMVWRAGVGICGPEFPSEGIESCKIPEISTAVDDFRTRGTEISLRDNTAVVFRSTTSLTDRIPQDCANVPNGNAIRDACNHCQGTCGICPGEPMCSERVWRGEVPGCDRCLCCPDPDATPDLTVPTGRRLTSAHPPMEHRQLVAEQGSTPSAMPPKSNHRRAQARSCGMPSLSDLTPGVVTRMCPAGATACADGSEFSFLVRRGSGMNERKVLIDFMGGGACWDEECLRPDSTRFQRVRSELTAVDGLTSTEAGELLSLAGFSAFALSDSAESVADTSTWTYVFVPYCTQDIHLGTCNQTYTDPASGASRTLRHNGLANSRAAVDWATINSFPASSPPSVLAFIGCSAGAAAVIVTEAARASWTYRDSAVRIVAVGDSPSNTLTEAFVHEGLLKWGVLSSMKEVADLTGYSPSPLRASLLTDAVNAVLDAFPLTRMGFYTSNSDTIASTYWMRMGGVSIDASEEQAAASWLRHMLDKLEGLSSQLRYANNSNFQYFVGNIPGHCTMTFDVARDNPGFDQWLTAMLDGQSLGSHDCGDGCTLTTVAGCDGLTGSGRLEDRCGVCDGQGTTCPAQTGALCTCDANGSDLATEYLPCNTTARPAEYTVWPPTVTGVTYNRWNGIPGTSMDEFMSAPHYIYNPPDVSSVFMDFFESPTNVCDECGTVMDAFFQPLATGEYIFMLAADDNSNLWFGDSMDAAMARDPIATVPGWTASRQWNKYGEQLSAPISLRAGEFYYLRAAVNEGGGGDNLCVGVRTPVDELLPLPVIHDGNVLLYVPPSSAADGGNVAIEVTPPTDCVDADLSVVAPGLRCSSVVDVLGCNTDLSTVSPGQSGTLASLCPVACNVCSAPSPPPASLDAVGLEFEAYECNLDPNAGCSMHGGFNLKATTSSHLHDSWDGMMPTIHDPAFDMPIWFSGSFTAIPGLASSRAMHTIMRWRGFLRVPATGSYDFQTHSDDGSLLYISGKLVVDNDGDHGMQSVGGTVQLVAGYHPIAILFYNKGGGGGLEVSWRESTAVFQPLAPDDTRPTVPGLYLETYSFPSGTTLSSAERGVLAPKWNSWTPLETVGAFSDPLWWSTRKSVLDAILSGEQTGGVAARWSGRLHTAISGQYAFMLRSGDGSRLYINSQIVVDNDGRHSMKEASGTIQIEAGWQTIVLVYYSSSQDGNGGLQVSLRKPGLVSFEPLNMTDTRPRMLSPTPSIGDVDVCDCSTNLDTIFASPEGTNILTAAAFHSICEWEDTLMQDKMLAYSSHCEVSQSSGSCCMPQSLPRMLSSALRIPCDALTDEHITNAIGSLSLGSLSLGGVSLDTIADAFVNEEWLRDTSNASLATRSRSLLCLDLATFSRIGNKRAGTSEALGAAILIPYDDHLEERAADTSEDEPRRFVFNLHLFHEFFLKQLFRDLKLAAIAFVLLFLCLAVHTGSVCLAVAGMLHILLSVPISYGIYMQQMQFEVFPYINLIGIFVVAGIGVDDIYVFTDAWKQSFYLLPSEAPLASRLAFAYTRAATAMLITSLTTAVAFLVNTVSPIPPIRLFGIWMALLICVDYLLVITWYPLIQLAHHRLCRNKWCCCLCRRKKSIDTAGGMVNKAGRLMFGGPVERCFHSTWSRLIFRLRGPIAVVFLGISVVAGYQVFDSLTLATQEVQLLRSNHQFSQYLQQVDLFRASPHRAARMMDIEWYFGVLPADCKTPLCYYVNSNRGELAIDESFDIADPAAQRWILQLVADLRSQSWVDHERTREHPLENFDRWLKELGGERTGEPCVHRCNCTRCSCEYSRLPLAREDFYQCHEQFLRTGFREACSDCLATPGSRNEPGGTWWFKNNSVPAGEIQGSMPRHARATRFFQWRLATTHVGSWDYYKTIAIYDSLEQILQKHRATRPLSAGDGGFFTHWWFTISDLQANLATSALESMVLATAITLLVLFIATRSLQATVIATVAIAGVLCCTMAVLVFLGWEMGIIESMCLAILIGISCDFVVHLAWAYVTAGSTVDAEACSPPEQRILGTQSESELRSLCSSLRKELGLDQSALAYDSAKTFPVNRSTLADELERAIADAPAAAKAGRTLMLQRVRFARTQFALGTMGISVSSAAGTTLVAAVALSQGIIEFFHAFGLFLIFTISFALLFAIVFFAACAMIYGPTGPPCGCCRKGQKRKDIGQPQARRQGPAKTTDI